MKKETLTRCFPVNFAKFLRTPLFTEHLWSTVSDRDLSTLLVHYRRLTTTEENRNSILNKIVLEIYLYT